MKEHLKEKNGFEFVGEIEEQDKGSFYFLII